MNGIEKITAKLQAEAQAEIDLINEGADNQCREIASACKARAEEEYRKRLQSGQKACEDRVQRLQSAAEMDAKKSILAFKQDMVAKAFEKAIVHITEMPREEYVSFLAAQAAKASGGKGGELIFNAKDAKAVSRDVLAAATKLLSNNNKNAAKLVVSKETRDIPGGVIVRQGDIELNCAVDTLVSLYRNQLSAQVAEILFA